MSLSEVGWRKQKNCTRGNDCKTLTKPRLKLVLQSKLYEPGGPFANHSADKPEYKQRGPSLHLQGSKALAD